MRAFLGQDLRRSLRREAQLDEGMRRGVINAEERRQLEELRTMTIDTIRVDDFEHSELVAASSLKGTGAAVRAA